MDWQENKVSLNGLDLLKVNVDADTGHCDEDEVTEDEEGNSFPDEVFWVAKARQEVNKNCKH